jgi:nitroimidazol reductase NimA-like FMN-containing flavoprotein (pyridoxamine 5'-phosphate oxidase superfamily)
VTRITRVQQRELSEAEREAVLASDVSAILAFIDAQGFPRQLPCWFLWTAPAFYVTSLAEKFHVRRLQADARASICIEVTQHSTTRRSNQQVKGVGRVEILNDAGDWGLRIREKYLGGLDGPAPVLDGSARVLLRLQPERLTAHGGAIEIN